MRNKLGNTFNNISTRVEIKVKRLKQRRIQHFFSRKNENVENILTYHQTFVERKEKINFLSKSFICKVVCHSCLNYATAVPSKILWKSSMLVYCVFTPFELLFLAILLGYKMQVS